MIIVNLSKPCSFLRIKLNIRKHVLYINLYTGHDWPLGATPGTRLGLFWFWCCGCWTFLIIVSVENLDQKNINKLTPGAEDAETHVEPTGTPSVSKDLRRQKRRQKNSLSLRSEREGWWERCGEREGNQFLDRVCLSCSCQVWLFVVIYFFLVQHRSGHSPPTPPPPVHT